MALVVCVSLKEQEINGKQTLAGTIVQLPAATAPQLVKEGKVKYQADFKPSDLEVDGSEEETELDDSVADDIQAEEDELDMEEDSEDSNEEAEDSEEEESEEEEEEEDSE